MIHRSKTTKPLELDLGLTPSRSDRPSQQDLSVSPKYTLPQQPLNAISLSTPTYAQDSLVRRKSNTPSPLLASDNQEKHTQVYEKLSETMIQMYTASPHQELEPKKQESTFENEDSVSVSCSPELKFRARSKSNFCSSSSESSTHGQDTGDQLENETETLKKKENHSASSNYLPCDKVQLQIINMNQDTRKNIAQTERNNLFKKLLLDTFENTCSIVAETDDLIVEYCIRKEQIVNFSLCTLLIPFGKFGFVTHRNCVATRAAPLMPQ
ncbi:hypothetical protein ElyMa_001533600 [Elysia marginata]|uniref:Uncharacterized protein n=1 Tax=Elysia marginata TaxID=1093978 RepID=A0AAV4J923_9GAST|nr:hypothetical protein ElyMa_001533600 [Elysia marginata]